MTVDGLVLAAVDAAAAAVLAGGGVSSASVRLADARERLVLAQRELDRALWDLYEVERSAPAVSRVVWDALLARGVSEGVVRGLHVSHDHVRWVVGSRRDPRPRP